MAFGVWGAGLGKELVYVHRNCFFKKLPSVYLFHSSLLENHIEDINTLIAIVEIINNCLEEIRAMDVGA